jgi:hypothetical protein
MLVEFMKEVNNTFYFITVMLMKAEVSLELPIHYSYRLVSSHHWFVNNDVHILKNLGAEVCRLQRTSC